MATLQQSVVTFNWLPADPPAQAGSFALLSPEGLPDIADIAALLVPFAGTVVGISVQGAPQGTDTVTVRPVICTSSSGAGATPVASLAATITNAAPNTSAIVTKDQADAQFAAGAYIGLQYQTATGGTYAPRDLLITVYISTGRTDI